MLPSPSFSVAVPQSMPLKNTPQHDATTLHRCSAPILTTEKHPHHMILPPSWFIVTVPQSLPWKNTPQHDATFTILYRCSTLPLKNTPAACSMHQHASPLHSWKVLYRWELVPGILQTWNWGQRISFLTVWESFRCFFANSKQAVMCLALRRGFSDQWRVAEMVDLLQFSLISISLER